MKITVHEAAQRTRNEVALDDVIGLISDIAYDFGFDVDITSKDDIYFTNKDGVDSDYSELWISASDLGFKDSSGGKLVADKSAESVLAKLSRELKAYIANKKIEDDGADKMAKAYDAKAKEMRKGE